jgi:hypothetical protein
MTPYQRLKGVRFDNPCEVVRREILAGGNHRQPDFSRIGLERPGGDGSEHHISTAQEPLCAWKLNPCFPAKKHAPARQKNRTLATPLAVLLGAVLPPKLPPVVLSMAGLAERVRMDQVTD